MSAEKIKCLVCENEYKSSVMTKHLLSCLENNAGEEEAEDCCLLRISAPETPYVVWLVMRKDATLDQLDEVVWGLWLSCCSEHGSEFLLKREVQDLDRTLYEYESGTTLNYCFDFSDPTDLVIQVAGFVKAKMPLEADGVLAGRNNDPEYTCDHCGEEPAVQVCCNCFRQADALYCEGCLDEHQCDGEDEPWWLEVVNSPRMGICGYAEIGGEYDEDGEYDEEYEDEDEDEDED